jgi:L-2,4-diaminobutyric acid acetyltransferase
MTTSVRSIPCAIRATSPEDGAAMAGLACELVSLDRYSPYLYVLLCDRFASTCAIASDDKGCLGFVTGFRDPNRQDVIFVWQIGVSPRARRKGLAEALLVSVLARDSNRDVRLVETTVSTDNVASRALFVRLARRLGTTCTEHDGYDSKLFPGPHQAEPLLRIGPFTRSST